MRSSSYRIVAPLFVLLVLSTVQGIKLERSNDRSFNRRLHQSLDAKGSQMTRGSGAALVLCKESRSRHCSSSSVGVDQRIPRIHEDYFGPGDHKSKHH